MGRWKQWWIMLAAIFHLMASDGGGFDPAKDVKIAYRDGHVLLDISPGGHISRQMLEMKVASGPGKVQFALPPASGKDDFGEGYYKGRVRVPITFEGLQGNTTLEVSYQACADGTGGVCFPPISQMLKIKADRIGGAASPEKTLTSVKGKAIEINGKPAEAAKPLEAPKTSAQWQPQSQAQTQPQSQSQPQTQPQPAAPAQEEKHSGLFWLLLAAFGAGLASCLSPCIYPMIPITMAVLGAKSNQGGVGGMAKGFMLSLALVLGMSVTYTTLGVVAALAGGQLGAFAQSAAFLIPVSLVFAALALSLLGAFEISLPQALQQKLQGDGPRRGFGGAFITGVVLGPLAAPCAGPFIGSLLLETAKTRDAFTGGLAFFVFSLGMGVLFMVVGTFSAGLPKSGDWLTRFKHIMGVVILGFAVWNIRLVIPGWLSYGLWSLTMLVSAAVFGVFEKAEGLLEQCRKSLAALLLATGLLLGVRSVELGLDLALLPRSSGVEAHPASPQEKLWINHDFEKAKEKAQKEGKLLLVDTFAQWCSACKELDEKTWPDKSVSAWLEKNAVSVRIDTHAVRPDLAGPLKITSYPTIILMDASGKEIRRTFGFLPPDKMMKWLEGKG